MKRNNSNTDIFVLLLNALGDSIDATMKLHILHQIMQQNANNDQERKQLIQDVADEVLARISATVDMTDVFLKIDELNKRLDRLGR